jgi:hypothetical protein
MQDLNDVFFAIPKPSSWEMGEWKNMQLSRPSMLCDNIEPRTQQDDNGMKHEGETIYTTDGKEKKERKKREVRNVTHASFPSYTSA